MIVKSEKDFVKFAKGDITEGDRLLFEAIQSGLSPFRFESIDTRLEYDIDMYAYRIFAHANLKNNYGIANVTTIQVDEILDNPAEGAKKVADAMFEKFRKRVPGYTIPLNIILSEN